MPPGTQARQQERDADAEPVHERQERAAGRRPGGDRQGQAPRPASGRCTASRARTAHPSSGAPASPARGGTTGAASARQRQPVEDPANSRPSRMVTPPSTWTRIFLVRQQRRAEPAPERAPVAANSAENPATNSAVPPTARRGPAPTRRGAPRQPRRLPGHPGHVGQVPAPAAGSTATEGDRSRSRREPAPPGSAAAGNQLTDPGSPGFSPDGNAKGRGVTILPASAWMKLAGGQRAGARSPGWRLG